jgi:hypothetical protein
MSFEVWHHYAQTTDGLWHRFDVDEFARKTTRGGCDIAHAPRFSSHREGVSYVVNGRCPKCEVTQ